MDNRGSHFYLTLFWAEALAEQNEDLELKTAFSTVAEQLKANQEKILKELNDVQGNAVDIDGYYLPNEEKVGKAMRPSETFNAILNL